MTIKELIEKHGDIHENWLILEFLTNKEIFELKFSKNYSVDDIYDDFLKILEKKEKNIILYSIYLENGIFMD